MIATLNNIAASFLNVFEKSHLRNVIYGMYKNESLHNTTMWWNFRIILSKESVKNVCKRHIRLFEITIKRDFERFQQSDSSENIDLVRAKVVEESTISISRYSQQIRLLDFLTCHIGGKDLALKFYTILIINLHYCIWNYVKDYLKMSLRSYKRWSFVSYCFWCINVIIDTSIYPCFPNNIS